MQEIKCFFPFWCQSNSCLVTISNPLVWFWSVSFFLILYVAVTLSQIFLYISVFIISLSCILPAWVVFSLQVCLCVSCIIVSLRNDSLEGEPAFTLGSRLPLVTTALAAVIHPSVLRASQVWILARGQRSARSTRLRCLCKRGKKCGEIFVQCSCSLSCFGVMLGATLNFECVQNDTS